MAKRFAFLSFGVLCLMLTALIGFHIGSQSAQAQAPEPITGWQMVGGHNSGIPSTGQFVMLSNGDVYFNWTSTASNGSFDRPAFYMGNFWTGGTVTTSPSTWGSVKGKYDGKK